MKLEWPEYGLSFEQFGDKLLVKDDKVLAVSGEENCYLISGWNLSNTSHKNELKTFIEVCCSRGFRWALQEGHPQLPTRGLTGKSRPYFGLSRAYSPQPAWDIVIDNPGGATYVVQKRHEQLLDAVGIGYEHQTWGGRNLKISRSELVPALEVIGSLSDVLAEIREKEEDQKEQKILGDTTVPDKDRKSLVRSRIGQGVFRQRVLVVEPYCRLTGVSDPRFLRASHIKPWRVASYTECLDGNNGLMLSPHVDHLFDQGYISFEKSGRLLISDGVVELLRDWSLPEKAIGDPFSDAQDTYLAHHRESIFGRNVGV